MRYLMAVFVWLAAFSLDPLYCMQVSEPPLSIELKTGGPTVSELREQYRTLDQQCLELAKRLRSNEDAAPANRQSLTELVERAFRVRQDLQRAEVAENARRLQKIQQTIESREGLKSLIVQRRIDELLNTNLNWQRNDLMENNNPLTRGGTGEPPRELDRQQSDISFNPQPQVRLMEGKEAANSKPLVDASDLLRLSPAQMRELLEEKARFVKNYSKNCEDLRTTIKNEGDKTSLVAELQHCEDILKYREEQLRFAKLQYDETIKYLRVAVESVQQQLEIAEQDHAVKTALFQRGSVSRSEVNAALARPRELQVELQRIESLLKLYSAAGDIPELAEVSKPSGSTLGFNIGDAKLGVPVWIEGSGGLTTSPGGYAIVSRDQRGLVAQILFSNIPDRENARLMLKVEAPVSVSEALRSRGVGETAWQSVREVSISDAEIQAAIDGKPFRKSYFMKPDGSMVEKDTDSEAAKNEKDPLVATIELAVP